jgi:hypothetical protein
MARLSVSEIVHFQGESSQSTDFYKLECIWWILIVLSIFIIVIILLIVIYCFYLKKKALEYVKNRKHLANEDSKTNIFNDDLLLAQENKTIIIQNSEIPRSITGIIIQETLEKNTVKSIEKTNEVDEIKTLKMSKSSSFKTILNV